MSDISQVVQNTLDSTKEFVKQNPVFTLSGIISGILSGIRVINPDIMPLPDYASHILVSSTIAYGVSFISYQYFFNKKCIKQNISSRKRDVLYSVALGISISIVAGEIVEYVQAHGMMKMPSVNDVVFQAKFAESYLLAPSNHFFNTFSDTLRDRIANGVGTFIISPTLFYLKNLNSKTYRCPKAH